MSVWISDREFLYFTTLTRDLKQKLDLNLFLRYN